MVDRIAPFEGEPGEPIAGTKYHVNKVLAERVRLEFYGYPANYLETYKAALEKVTTADLDAVAKKYIHPEKLAVLVVGNGSEIKPGLDELKLGPVQTVDITIPQPGNPEKGH